MPLLDAIEMAAGVRVTLTSNITKCHHFAATSSELASALLGPHHIRKLQFHLRKIDEAFSVTLFYRRRKTRLLHLVANCGKLVLSWLLPHDLRTLD
jgi:hypothetical protein